MVPEPLPEVKNEETFQQQQDLPHVRVETCTWPLISCVTDPNPSVRFLEDPIIQGNTRAHARTHVLRIRIQVFEGCGQVRGQRSGVSL